MSTSFSSRPPPFSQFETGNRERPTSVATNQNPEPTYRHYQNFSPPLKGAKPHPNNASEEELSLKMH